MFVDGRKEKCAKFLAVWGPANITIFFDRCCAGNPRLLFLILDFPYFFQKLLKTVSNHLYLGFLKHGIGKLYKLEDFFVLFLENGFLWIDKSLLAASLITDSFNFDVIFSLELIDFLSDCPGKSLSDGFRDISDTLKKSILTIVVKLFCQTLGSEFLEAVEREEGKIISEPISLLLDGKKTSSWVVDGEEKVFIEDAWHFSHIVPSHTIFPDTEVFRQFILPEEADLLKCIVALFISQPTLPW